MNTVEHVLYEFLLFFIVEIVIIIIPPPHVIMLAITNDLLLLIPTGRGRARRQGDRNTTTTFSRGVKTLRPTSRYKSGFCCVIYDNWFILYTMCLLI